MAKLDQTTAASELENVYQGDVSAVSIEAVSDKGMIDLRIEADDTKAMKAAETALGIKLPIEPQSSAHKDGVSVLWWSIDQWIITFPIDKLEEILQDLNEKLSSFHCAITNMSEARTIIQLTGADAKTVLMKGQSVDLTLDHVKKGYVRRTSIGDVPIAIHVLDDEVSEFEIFVFRSYTDYMWQWLSKAGRRSAVVSLFKEQPLPTI